MNFSYEYYVLTRELDNYPDWIQSERYFNCENFVRILDFFKKR